MNAVRPVPCPAEANAWHGVAPALGMLLASVALLVGLSLRLPDAGSQVALVFSPRISPDQALGGLAGIDARIVRFGGFDNVVVAYFERPVSWAEMRRLGVLLSLDPIVAGGCASPSQQPPVPAEREWT